MSLIARRVADKLMPWVAANATVWPSTHAKQAVLLEQIKELEAEAATNRGAVEDNERMRLALRALLDKHGDECGVCVDAEHAIPAHTTGGSSP